MKKTFKGRVVVPGAVKLEAVVTHEGFNILASCQKSAMKKDNKIICSDHNNKDLFKKNLTKKALALPQTIGSTTGGMVLQTVAKMGIAPKAMLFSKEIDSIAAAGVILSKVWNDYTIVTVDNLGEDFLNFVKDNMKICIEEDGTVVVEDFNE